MCATKELFTILVIWTSLASARPQLETASDGMICYPLLHSYSFSRKMINDHIHKILFSFWWGISSLVLPQGHSFILSTLFFMLSSRSLSKPQCCSSAGTGLAVATIGAMGSSVVTGMMLARSSS